MSEMLHTPRLTLRQPEAGDWPVAKAFFMSERAKGIGGPHDLGVAWRAFATEIGHWSLLGYGMWIVTRTGDNKALGLIGPWCPADWPENEIGWMIWDDSVEGTGIATEAATATIKHAFDVLGWNTAVSYIAYDNERSIALAKKLGAKLDENAPQPHPDRPCYVYRHPRPRGLV